MTGKTIVITGATSGIGEVAAVRLAAEGARIVLIARDRQRAAETLRRLEVSAPGRGHTVHYADLSRLAQMKRVAQEILAREQQIDVLVNNAGALFNQRALTEDGLERTFATNHLAYFVVTNLLLERLQASPGARIISTASAAHERSTLDFADLQSARGFSGMRVYGRSKLMNILFTRELARRLVGTGVTANCLHPGFVATRFGDASGGWLFHTMLRAAKGFALTPEKGAETLTYLASSQEVQNVSGAYFVRCRQVTPSRAAQSAEDARRLWEVSAQIAGVGIPA
jgi:NAD(P)-dependent dehydrogenase (short-subunit alcohol dehydrogenase family)